MMRMSDPVKQKIRDEFRQFREMLGSLLETHRGQWVVFLDGRVQGFFDGENAAYASAVERFGSDAGFVVAPVSEDLGPVPASAFVLLPA